MKKVLIILMCFIIVFSLSSCKKQNADYDSYTSSDVVLDQTITVIESQSDTSTTDTEGNNNLSTPANEDTSYTEVNSNIEENSSSTQTPHDSDTSYRNIVCNQIINFKQVGFSIKSSNTMLFVTLPKEWTLEKSKNGYNILKNSQAIGKVTASAKATTTDEMLNVFYNEITVNDVKVTHSIDRITSDNKPSYIRTLCYNYDDENGNSKSVSLTVPYQEIDSSAAYKMIMEVKKSTSYTKSNLGILQIQDNRNKILILGNSFINSSSIGNILQTMCGNEVYVEAHSRGYAHVGTYTNDANMMQKIRDCNYSAVFICGLYDQLAVSDLEAIINICKESDTKLAIFPAHNESRSEIDSANSMYPNTVIIDWKAEIDNLISTGIDVSYFCIPDAHNHSTPLAGYVGAHMIYRAVFNKIPQTTQFMEVSESQINLLGEYVTTGSIVLLDEEEAYVID